MTVGYTASHMSAGMTYDSSYTACHMSAGMTHDFSYTEHYIYAYIYACINDIYR